MLALPQLVYSLLSEMEVNKRKYKSRLIPETAFVCGRADVLFYEWHHFLNVVASDM